jgi:hypothetical protein
VKYDSSDEAEIWARSCRSCLTTYIISRLSQVVVVVKPPHVL